VLIDVLKIPIVLQKRDTVLNNDSGDQTVDRIPDCPAFPPQFPTDRRSQFKSRPIVGEVDQSAKQAFGGNKLLLLPDSLQNFGEENASGFH
jgi:hypothetical protein